MKYLKFIAILAFTLFRKVFGLFWFWVVVPFRGIARNKVYNYILNNDLYLKRLYERNPIDMGGSWRLTGNRVEEGTVLKQYVSKLTYLNWYWLVWIWVDDDSNRDIVDITFIETILSGERKSWVTKYFGNRLQKEYTYLKTCVYGNTFELGDKRALYKISLHKCFLSAGLWLLRNTAYNAKYDMYETVDTNDVFLFTVAGKRFGWLPEGIVQGKQNYTLVFWE